MQAISYNDDDEKSTLKASTAGGVRAFEKYKKARNK